MSLDDAQVETLMATVTANLASLRALWMDRRPRSDFRDSLLKALEAIRLRERSKFLPQQATPPPQLKFICIPFGATILPSGQSAAEIVCPFCQQPDWIFSAHRD